MNNKKKNNIIDFPSSPTKIERQVEAILFAASEPLDVETIEKRINTSVNLTTNSEEGFPGNAEYIVDVTDTSNVKVRLLTGSVNSNSRLRGSTSLNLTSFTFIRLANT